MSEGADSGKKDTDVKCRGSSSMQLHRPFRGEMKPALSCMEPPTGAGAMFVFQIQIGSRVYCKDEPSALKVSTRKSITEGK